MLLGATHHDLEPARLQVLTAGCAGLAERLVGADAEPDGPLRGLVVLATCNRVELYLDVRRFHDAVDLVTGSLGASTGLTATEVGQLLRVQVGAPVGAHLFQVAAGLDSMVVGEAEIAGQVAAALRSAQLTATASTTLNALFQRASRLAKQVRRETSLGSAGRSVASVALDVAEFDGPVAGETALIIGTGAYARVVAAALRARGCIELMVYSRSSARAARFADRHEARPVSAEELSGVLADVDLVVTCSGKGGVLTAPMLADRRRGLRILDLALIPDVTAEVRTHPLVRVIDLLTVQSAAPAEHSQALRDAQDLVIAAVAEFEDAQVARGIDPAVVALRDHVADAVRKEMDRIRVKFDDQVAAELEQSMHRVTRSMLHTPTLRAQQLARSGNAADYLAALHTLFGITLPAS